MHPPVLCSLAIVTSRHDVVNALGDPGKIARARSTMAHKNVVKLCAKLLRCCNFRARRRAGPAGSEAREAFDAALKVRATDRAKYFELKLVPARPRATGGGNKHGAARH